MAAYVEPFTAAQRARKICLDLPLTASFSSGWIDTSGARGFSLSVRVMNAAAVGACTISETNEVPDDSLIQREGDAVRELTDFVLEDFPGAQSGLGFVAEPEGGSTQFTGEGAYVRSYRSSVPTLRYVRILVVLDTPDAASLATIYAHLA